jgi:hypothetical protein
VEVTAGGVDVTVCVLVIAGGVDVTVTAGGVDVTVCVLVTAGGVDVTVCVLVTGGGVDVIVSQASSKQQQRALVSRLAFTACCTYTVAVVVTGDGVAA